MTRQPSDLSPREARNYYLDHRQTDATDKTLRSYHNRLTRFVEWCEETEIERMSDLSGWDIDQFERFRRGQGVAPTTIYGQMVAVRKLLRYCARIEVVDPELPERVEIPDVSKDEETSDIKLAAEDATDLIAYYRDPRGYYGTVGHAVIEVLWHTGCRLSGLRSLDLDDYDSEEQYLHFTHHSQTGTALKKKASGERAVAINETVCEVLDTYIARERPDKRDEFGREPLFSGRQGRPSDSTIRAWAYLGTQPCLHGPCPHGRKPHSCKYRERSHASKCPSSRSPHQIRTGSITWHRDCGVPMEITAERVNASPDVIERFYDKANHIEKMQNHRQNYVQNLDLEDTQ